MRNLKRTLAVLLATLMLVTALPLGVFATENTVADESGANEDTQTSLDHSILEEDYYFKYTFDEAEVDSSFSGTLSGVKDSDSNPYGMSLDGTVNGTVKAHENGDGNYLSVKYAWREDDNSGSWRGMRFSLVDGTTDYSIANGVEVNFKFRWLGNGTVASNSSMIFFQIRRAKANDNNSATTDRTEINLLTAKVSETTGGLVISGASVGEILTLPKNSTDFTDFKIVYHDVTKSYSVYINGVPYIEGVTCASDLRGSSYVSTTYDDDLVATRTPVSGASDKWSLQIARISNATIEAAYEYDIDDLVIKDGDYYANTFTTAKTSANSFATQTVSSGNVFNINNDASSSGVSIGTETVNGVDNNFLSFSASSRLDLKDSVYQFVQDGNWTVDFKLRATTTASSKVNIFRFFDRVSTVKILYVDSSGNLYIDNHKLPGVTIPKADTNEWARITLSVTVDDTNIGEYDDFAANKTYSRYYRIAVWVDGKYAGDKAFSRKELLSDGLRLNDKKSTVTALTEAPDLTDIPLVDSSNGMNTHKAADGTLYQLKYNTDGTFASGVKVTFATATSADVIGFFNKETESVVTGAIDDLSIYKGIGPKEYADGENQDTGVISEIEFGRLSTTATHLVTENASGKNAGKSFIVSSRANSSGDFTRVEATDTESSYVSVNNAQGSGTSYLDLSAAYSGGKVFSAEMVLRNVNSANDFCVFTLRRQAATDNKQSQAIFIEASTSYMYFKVDNIKYYLCNSVGKLYDFGESDWKKVKVVFDETGSEPLVSFLVNDQVVYYRLESDLAFDLTYPAVGISGIVSSDVYALKDAVDQRVRFYYNESAVFSFDARSAKIEYCTAPKAPVLPEYLDYAAIDFSDFENLNDFASKYGHQFTWSDGVTIENGVLKIPSTTGYFGWIDYNETFAEFIESNNKTDTGKSIEGYNVEAKIKIDAPTSANNQAIFRLDHETYINDGFTYLGKNGNVYCTGGKESGCPVNDTSADTFSDVSATFYTGDDRQASIFVDGKLAGVSRFTNISKSDSLAEGARVVVFEITGCSEVAELYIHSDLKRELATKSGNIFELDPGIFLPANDGAYPGDGVWSASWFNTYNNSTYSTVQTYTDDVSGESFKYYQIDVPSSDVISGTSHPYSEVYVTDYMEDKTTVFEYDLRYTAYENATKNMELLYIRRSDVGINEPLGETLLNILPNGVLKTFKGEAYNAAGEVIKVSSSDWQKIAVIYDSDAGKISYRINGQIPYYKDSEGNLVLADKIQLDKVRYYRMDSEETKIRTLSMTAGFMGKLDLANFKIYTIDETANAGYIGVQKDTSGNNIRLIAGVDMLYYANVGFVVEALDKDGNSIGNAESYDTNIVYSSVVETLSDGTTRNVYPEDYGYRYLYTANISNIPTEQAVKLKVTPFTWINGKQYNASTVTVDIDFTDSDVNNWTADTKSVEVKPVGTNTSKDANFSTTEIVSYTNDGALEFNGLDAKFAFAAELNGGVVSVNLTNAFGEVSEKSVFDIYVNNFTTPTKTVELEFGHHTVVLAEGLSGENKFMIVKRSGGDFVRINSMSVNGTLTTPPELAVSGAVNVVVNAPTGTKAYGDVEVYVRTTDPSEKYYIRYNFDYIKQGTNDYTYLNGISDTHSNTDMYRIVGANLVEKTDNGYTSKFGILQEGEISLAIKESWMVPADMMDTGVATQINAKDFIGGFHGDELLVADGVKFLLDGNEIDPTVAGEYNGTHFEFIQDTVINRCDEEEMKVMNHGQHILLDTNGLRLDQHIEFLRDDFYPKAGNTYLQMATAYRINTGIDKAETETVTDSETGEQTEVLKRSLPKNLIIHTNKLYDANGNEMGSYDMKESKYTYNPSGGYVTVACGNDNKSVNRYVEYIGDKGVYGKVGFVIDDASVQSDSASLQIRLQQGDNKWYASFDTYNGDTVPKGEVWNVSDYYYFDYNTTLYGATATTVE